MQAPETPTPSRSRPWFRPGLLVWFLVLGAATLPPAAVPDGVPQPQWGLCVLCGGRGLADAVLNVGFFVPLGLLLARSSGVLRALGVGVLVSATVEMTQLLVPGRHSTLGDVVWNGLGAALGVVLYGVTRRALDARAPSPKTAPILAGAVGASLLLAGLLLAPAPTSDTYWGQWTPELTGMTAYEGSVLSARLNDEPLRDGRLADSRLVRALLRSGDWTLTVVVVRGPDPEPVAPIFSVYDEEQREILLLGAANRDLVWRERTRAVGVLLDQPDLRVGGGLGSTAPGDTVRITVSHAGDRRCLVIDDDRTCDLGFTPGRTWGLLLHPEGPGPASRLWVDAAWLFSLFLPLGLSSESGRRAAMNGAFAVLLTGVALSVTRLTVGSGWELAAVLLGLAIGFSIRLGLRSPAGGESLPKANPAASPPA